MSELEDLKKRVAELEKAAKPPEPFVPMTMPRRDPTEGFSMDRATMQAMVNAVPESVMQGIRADARKPNPIQASQSPIPSTPSAQQSQPRNTGGWRDEVPLGPPPGIDLCDRMVDAQDAKDRAELIERELKLARMGKGDAG